MDHEAVQSRDLWPVPAPFIHFVSLSYNQCIGTITWEGLGLLGPAVEWAVFRSVLDGM